MLLSHGMHVCTSSTQIAFFRPLLLTAPWTVIQHHLSYVNPSELSTLCIVFLESLNWDEWLMMSDRIGLGERVAWPWWVSILQTLLAVCNHLSWTPQGWSWVGIQGKEMMSPIMNELKQSLSALVLKMTANLTRHLNGHLQKTTGDNKIIDCCLKQGNSKVKSPHPLQQ